MIDLNNQMSYPVMADEMATKQLTLKENGIGNNSLSSLPTNSNSLCPPITSRRIVVICQHCGTAFRKVHAQYKLYKKHFCCRECYDLYRRIGVNCHRCGISFIINKYKFDNSKTKIFHCCWSCRKYPPIYCDWCGNIIEKGRFKKNKNKFCTIKCKADWTSENIHGEMHHNWKGGEQKYYGRSWDKQRKKAMERDNHTCQECGNHKGELDKRLNVHHKIPFRYFGLKRHEEANELDNLITYCDPCHRIKEMEVTI